MADAKRDNNRVTSLLGVSNVDNSTPVILWADPVTHALLISGTITVDTTGLATETKQDTIIGHLDGVEGLLTTIDTDTGNIATSTSSIDSKTPTLGQALAASSVPVVLTAAQLTTLTPPAAITGFATSAKQDTIIGHVDGVETSLTSIDGKITAVNTGAVVVSSSALPTGASTSAKQPALGTAGTASTDVITVQGIASMTALKVDGSAVTQPVSGTVAVTNAGTFATQVDGAALTSLQLIDDSIYTDGTGTVTKGVAILGQDGTNPQAIKTDASGELQVDVLSMPTTAVTGTFWQATQPVSLTSTTVTGTVAVTQSGTWDEVGINDSGNSITVDYATTGSGTATGALRVELPTNGTGTVGLNAGTNAIGKLSANSGVDIGDVDVTSISAGTNLIGDVGIQPRTTNGLDTFMASGSDGSSILVATAQAVKAAAGKVYGYYLYNPEAAVTFVHFYNTAAASVTVGTTSPLFTLAVPAGSAANLGITDMGVTFGTAISISATTTAGGNTAPTTGVSAVIWFK